MEGIEYLNPTATSGSNNSTILGYQHWSDFVFLGSVFLVPVVVSSLFSIFGKDWKCSEKFLMGDRQMSTLPVAISLFCGLISSIAVLGYPVGIYLHGTQQCLVLVILLPVALVFVHFYLPVYFNMELNSPFQYFEQRFSRATRMVVSTTSLIQTVIYLTLVVHFTSTFLQKVTGLNAQFLTAIIFMVSIFSSYVGGYQGVVWGNAIQVIMLVGSLGGIVLLGFLSIDNFQLQWDHVLSGNRIELFNFDPDPRAGWTVWTTTVGGYFMWFSFYAASNTVTQRLIWLPSITSAKRAVFLNVILLMVVLSLSYVLGLLMYGKYFGCDPVKVGVLDNYSVLVAHYVMNVARNYQGLYGLVLAGVVSPCISNVTSSLNSLSSLVIFDYFKHWIPNISEESIIFLSKISNVFLGGLSFALVLAARADERFLPLLWQLAGMTLGTILGMFTLGMTLPWANSKGSIMGMLITLLLLSNDIIFTSMDSTGSDHELTRHRLPLVITENCILTTFKNESSPSFLEAFNDHELTFPVRDPLIPATHSLVELSHSRNSTLSSLPPINFAWYPALGFTLTVFLGLLFSICFMKFQSKLSTSPECFTPCVLKQWLKWFPSHMSIWVEPDENLMLLSSSVFSFLPRSVERMNRRDEPKCDIEITRAN